MPRAPGRPGAGGSGGRRARSGTRVLGPVQRPRDGSGRAGSGRSEGCAPAAEARLDAAAAPLSRPRRRRGGAGRGDRPVRRDGSRRPGPGRPAGDHGWPSDGQAGMPRVGATAGVARTGGGGSTGGRSANASPGSRRRKRRRPPNRGMARDRLADRSLQAGNGEATRDRAAAPSAVGVPSPPPMVQRAPDGQGRPGAGRGRDGAGSVAPPAGSPPVTAAEGMPSGMHAERKKTEGAAAGGRSRKFPAR